MRPGEHCQCRFYFAILWPLRLMLEIVVTLKELERMRMFIMLCLMVVVAVLGVTGAEAQDLKVGDMAPAFSLPGTDGKTHSLSDYAGTPVVLAWFTKAFTGG